MYVIEPKVKQTELKLEVYVYFKDTKKYFPQ